MNKKQKFQKKHPGLHLILSTVERVIKKDKEYIYDHGNLYWNPDYLKLEHKGTDNYGQIVYSIHENGEGYGFFAELRMLLEKLLYADFMGFKPSVVYGKNYLYFDKEMNNNTPNAFEYYFDSIGGIEESNNSYNIIEEKRHYSRIINQLYNSSKIYKSYDDAMVSIIKKYIHIRKDLLNTIEYDFYDLFPNKKVLGIHYRGTDYKVGYNNHPQKVELEQIIKILDKYTLEYSYFFLATDEEGVYEFLQEKYGEKVKSYSDVKRSNGNVSVAFSKDDRKNHHYLLGLEVLRDMYSLSLCDGIICGQSQVTNYARWQKRAREEQYDNEIVIDNGINHNGIDFGNAEENHYV